MITKILNFLGLVTKAEHIEAMAEKDKKLEQFKSFGVRLGESAKAHGMSVILERERADYHDFCGDVFMIGDKGTLQNCRLKDSTVYVAPWASQCLLAGNRFVGKES
ncbi:hypothetical protein D3C85_1582330 [compost metagenome]